MAETLYTYANIGRAGLGNNLLPWARAEITSTVHGIRRIAPIWLHFKIGPILRGERDWRWYSSLFRHPNEISGLRRRWLLKRCEIVPEYLAEDLLREKPASGSPRIIEYEFYHFNRLVKKEFESVTQMFLPLLPHVDLLKKRLGEIIQPRHMNVIRSTFNEPFIGVHFRRGDKPPLKYGEPYPLESDHPTLPAEWYAKALREMRRLIGWDAPAIVFTDGTEEQAKLLLEQRNVKLAPKDNNAIVDLMLMAKSRAFVSTMSSSFSHWSAMLAKCPSIQFPGRQFHLVPDRPEMTAFSDVEGNVHDSAAPVFRAAFADVKPS
jgi:hypothetical protein